MADFKEIMVDGQVYQVKDETARENQGGYEPPAGGIPKTDLASDVQTSLGKADTALQQADKTQLQNAINSLQSALNTITQDGATQGVIDTFNEVKAFLEGIDTDDPTLFNQLKSLSDAITALQNTLSTKANDNAVVKSISVNGTAQTKDGNGNVNVSVPTLTLDDAPTAGSDNAVKSKGIKTALDNLLQNLTIGQNGNWYVGQTDTGVKAQGPQGNCTITDAGQMVSEIVNDLDTGGGNKFLSAEMGKVLKIAISTLIDSMGNYCFPNGRPTLSFEGPKADIVTNFNHVTSSNTAQRVDIGGRFETTLGTDDDLYILDENSVVVEMGGVDITTSSFTAATGRIYIGEVTGIIEITASGMTYVQSGLVCMFDGKHVDAANNRWVDLKNSSRVLTLSGCTVQNDHVEFDGVDDTALAAEGVGVNVDQSEGTIEGVFQISALDKVAIYPFANMYVANRRLMSISLRNGTTAGTNAAYSQWLSQSDSGVLNGWHIENDYTTAHLSMSSERAYLNGVALAHPNPAASPGLLTGSYSRMGIFSSMGDDNLPRSRQGKMYCVRIYSKKLSDLEIAQNYKIDRKRFNLL